MCKAISATHAAKLRPRRRVRERNETYRVFASAVARPLEMLSAERPFLVSAIPICAAPDFKIDVEQLAPTKEFSLPRSQASKLDGAAARRAGSQRLEFDPGAAWSSSPFQSYGFPDDTLISRKCNVTVPDAAPCARSSPHYGWRQPGSAIRSHFG
jgi:hypothetical protein